MVRRRRNVGPEILEGLRQLKRGEHGRILNVPSVGDGRDRPGVSAPRLDERPAPGRRSGSDQESCSDGRAIRRRPYLP